MSKIARASLLVVLSTVAASACVTTRAQTPEDRPALEVPAPPERVIPQVPAPEPALLPVEPLDELIITKPSSPTRSNKPPAKPPEGPKPDTNKPDVTPAPPTDPAPAPAPVTPQLKLPENGDAGVLSRQIRDSVERTRRVLGQTERAKLTALRQKAFDDATGFVKQAEDALNAKNLVFAKEVAEKAERLAKELQNR